MGVPPLQLSVTVTHEAGFDVIELAGDLDMITAPALRAVAFDPARCVQPVLVIRLDGLEFVDSQGISALVATRRCVLSRGGELVLLCSRPHLLSLLRISRLDSVLRVVSSLTDVVPAEVVA